MGYQRANSPREAAVRTSDHSHASVGFGRVLYQPVDGVVGVGNVIHLRSIQRPAHRARHPVVAFGSIFAADVLNHAYVSAGNEYIVSLKQPREQVRAVGAGTALRSAIWRPAEQNWRVFGAFGHNDDRVELDTVAHWDHHLALAVIVIGGWEGESFGRVSRRLAAERVPRKHEER